MFWRTRLALGASLLLGGVSGGLAVAIAITYVPTSAPLRGTLFGLAGGLFGISLFTAGVLSGLAGLFSPKGRRGDDSPAVRKPSVSPTEAKFWLQRFLEEHQQRPDTQR